MLVLCQVCKTDVYVVGFLQFEGAVVREQVLLVYVFYLLALHGSCLLFVLCFWFSQFYFEIYTLLV